MTRIYVPDDKMEIVEEVCESDWASKGERKTQQVIFDGVDG